MNFGARVGLTALPHDNVKRDAFMAIRGFLLNILYFSTVCSWGFRVTYWGGLYVIKYDIDVNSAFKSSYAAVRARLVPEVSGLPRP